MTPPKYDNNEYALLVELETHSRFLNNECDNANQTERRLNQMHFVSQQLVTYTQYLPVNDEFHKISQILAEDVEEMAARYSKSQQPSPGYCRIKSTIIAANADKALETLGKLQWNT